MEDRERRNKQINNLVASTYLLNNLITKILEPPKKQLSDYLSEMSTPEVEGIYRFGSEKGKLLAKEELIKRGFCIRMEKIFTKF